MTKKDDVDVTQTVVFEPTLPPPPRQPAITAKQSALTTELSAQSCGRIGIYRAIKILVAKGFTMKNQFVSQHSWAELRVRFPNINWQAIAVPSQLDNYLDMSWAEFSYPGGVLALRIFSEPFDIDRTVVFAHLREMSLNKTLGVLYTMFDFLDLDPQELTKG